MGILLARDLDVFVDESGDRGGKARYRLLTLAIHDQADSVSDKVARYEDPLDGIGCFKKNLLKQATRKAFSRTTLLLMRIS